MRKVIVVLVVALALGTVAYQVKSLLEVDLALVTVQESKLLSVQEPLELEFNRATKPEEQLIWFEPQVEITVSWSADGKTATIIPKEGLSYNTSYTLRGTGFELSFTTEPLPTFTIVAGGDVLLDKLPGENVALYGPDYVFAGMGDLLKNADIAFANLESPASRHGEKITPKNFTFRSTPEALDALVAASIDVVSFTNNHCLDFGIDAFLDTLEHLRERGIAYVGAGKNRHEALSPHVLEVNGVEVAFLAFTQKSFLPAWSYDLWEAQENKPGVIFLDGEKGRRDILTAVAEAEAQADVVLVSLHWGYEGTLAPQVWQQELAQAIIDAGATAILGHHPHLPFGVELYAGKPIIYSLGNYLFHPYDPAARESFVAHLEIDLLGEVQTKLYPIFMEQGTVRLLEGEQATRILQVIADRSTRLGTECAVRGDYVEVISVR
ncbi:MAG: CapA family protein [Peptococcaceae bacterium]|nr:CapA family protein [Peptococcaceae bacterium]